MRHAEAGVGVLYSFSFEFPSDTARNSKDEKGCKNKLQVFIPNAFGNMFAVQLIAQLSSLLTQRADTSTAQSVW